MKFAAVRKLQQELGLPPLLPGPASESKSGSTPLLPHLKFLTRMHYWAADTVTWGPESPWGEHEIDYVLVCRARRELVDGLLEPNPEEVDGVMWVSRDRLGPLMDDEDNGMIWSPWFKIIARRWLMGKGGWWEDLDETMRDGSKVSWCTDPHPTQK